jgi:ribonuclease D
MRTITNTEELREFCQRAREHPYITVDTEFLRERTYYSKLCLIQLAFPGADQDSAVLVDPLVDGLLLDPLVGLFRDTSVTKVFHAARQDLFDTQVAAMVCGFGEQVSYETLVRKIAQASLDKTSRFTDWSQRPLSQAQQTYALADVTHLRDIYEHLSASLEKSGRRRWVQEELSILTNPDTYITRPENAWQRVKTRSNAPRFLGIVKFLAEFRERHAQDNNVPRSRVFKDDALVELASTKPQSMAELGKLRLLLRDARKGVIADGILEAVKSGLAIAKEDLPKPDTSRDGLQVNPALADLLRVLLKSKTESFGVASRLIAPAADLDAIAAGLRDVPALRGWRHEVFGADALRLCNGEVALSAKGQRVILLELQAMDE